MGKQEIKLTSTDKLPNGPFPSCCLSRFRSESWCSTIEREMSLICIRIRNLFPFEWLCIRTHCETEACTIRKSAINPFFPSFTVTPEISAAFGRVND